MKSSPAAAFPPPPDSASQSSGMSNCYVFKSRLQEYTQKAGFLTPEYHTVKEGPAHDPVFRSSVMVNSVNYDSLPGFFNRKVAEQSAAEVALIEIHKSGEKTECIPTVHETGLSKNMLQVYAQKMNYAIPAYICTKQPTGASPFTCTIDIGGIQYIGAAARTKKEAEIKAARTALLAIERSAQAASNGASQYTVLPGQKKVVQTQPGSKKQLKPKKDGFKKKFPKMRSLRKNGDRAKLNGDQTGNGPDVDASSGATGSTDVNMAEEHLEGLIANEVEQESDKGKNENGRPPQDSVIKVETDVDASRVATCGTDVDMGEQHLERAILNEHGREFDEGPDECGIPLQDSNMKLEIDVDASRVATGGTDVNMGEQHLVGPIKNEGEQADKGKDKKGIPPQDSNIKAETDLDASRVASDGTQSLAGQLLEELTPNEGEWDSDKGKCSTRGEQECNKGKDEHGIPSQDSNIIVQTDVDASRVPTVGTDVSINEQHLEGLIPNEDERESHTGKDEHEMPRQDPNAKVETNGNCPDAQLEPVFCPSRQSRNNVEYVDDMPTVEVETS